MEEPYLSVEGMEVDEETWALRMLEMAIRETIGECVVETANYATDAGVYNAAGIPTVVFGPGEIAQAHTSAEYVEIEQVRQAEQILLRILS
jgi:acetylornithine deacetylase